MNLPMKTVVPTAEHMAFRKALEAAIAQHGRNLAVQDLLAIVSHMVGQLIALQDQRTMTPAMAMDLVAANIDAGNSSAIDQLLTQTGGNA